MADIDSNNVKKDGNTAGETVNITDAVMDIPCVAGAAISGIILNLILTLGDKTQA